MSSFSDQYSNRKEAKEVFGIGFLLWMNTKAGKKWLSDL